MALLDTATETIFYDAPTSLVYVADALHEADFVLVPHLRCDLLRRTVSPNIDQAILSFEYGSLRRGASATFGTVDPQILAGKFVKIVIQDTEGGYYAHDIEWYGKIILDERTMLGSLAVNASATPTGEQQFTAFGLMWLLATTVITNSMVSTPARDDVEPIKCGLPFNYDRGGAYIRKGNRTPNRIDGAYAFTAQPRSPDEWDAYNAVLYLLKYHAPRDLAFGEPTPNEWRFDSAVTEETLNWYTITVPTDGQTVKEVIDSLINRRRGVCWWCEFDAYDDSVVVKVATFNETPIALGGLTIAANPNQHQLDFDTQADVEKCVVSTTEVSRYHDVWTRGEKRTVTFTYRLRDLAEDAMLIPDWTAAEQTEFLAGASNAADYNDFDSTIKALRNSIYRSEDRLRNVFQRFIVNVDEDEPWLPIVPEWHGGNGDTYEFCHLIRRSTQPTSCVVGDANSEPQPIWRGGIRFLRHLPFLDRFDYGGTKIEEGDFSLGDIDDTRPDYQVPFAYIQTQEADYDTPERWELLDRTNLLPAELGGRRWACNLALADGLPAVVITAHPPQMIARKEFEDASPPAALTITHHDPRLMDGVDWRDIYVTLCAELDEVVSATKEISAPPPDSPSAVLVIDVPDCRFDFVIPFTTVAIKDGQPYLTDTGGAVRDDRLRLENIVDAAAEWYGRQRQTLDLTFNQCRATFELGWLITELAEGDVQRVVNTLVTSITYRPSRKTGPRQGTLPQMDIITSYADMDFS